MIGGNTRVVRKKERKKEGFVWKFSEGGRFVPFDPFLRGFSFHFQFQFNSKLPMSIRDLSKKKNP